MSEVGMKQRFPQAAGGGTHILFPLPLFPFLELENKEWDRGEEEMREGGY